MSDDLVDESVVLVESEGKKKKLKAKKRPSDFEIVRTILQRTSERKQAYLLKNLGEDADILFLCSVNEKGFTYGSSELSIAMIEITDPELKAIVDTCLGKLYGLNITDASPLTPFSGFICLRDQISELAKTKGEGIEGEVRLNEHGGAWIVREDKNGKEQSNILACAIESLFHVQLVASYAKSYRPLLDHSSDKYLYYPYSHTDPNTASILTLPPSDQHSHDTTKLYPHGFRTLVTKGLDVIITKGLGSDDFPYPVEQEEMIVFHEKGVASQLVHRIIAKGWRMIMVRPNAVYFPTLNTSLIEAGYHHL